jgi:diaminopimelate epimerase
MRFVKMHGIGNDYVYLDAVGEPALEKRDLAGLARKISDRHTGVGSDGLILLCRPTVRDAHVRMRMFNADGSESEMCGNGIRCVAKFAHDRLGVSARPMRVETGRGVLSIDYTLEGGKVASATVDMGEPILERERLPVDWGKLRPPMLAAGEARNPENPFDPLRRGMSSGGLLLDDTLVEFDLVSMGNPHAVILVGDSGSANFERADHRRLGPRIERDGAFPQGINVHWWEFRSHKAIRMKTWERGAGPTQACGTGACAVVVAGILEGRLDRRVRVTLPGGDLEVAWDAGTGHVFMTGPATDVFEGVWPD